MGFLSSLFSIFKSQEEREMDEIFAKINKYLNDDKTQLLGLHPTLRNMLDDDRMDKLPNATGEFGRDPGNPILCNGPLGEITYLSRLVMKTNAGLEPITFHRIGSVESPNTTHDIDVYEIIGYTGYMCDRLYLDFYHTTKSRICPVGYILEDKCIGFRGINQKNNDFPINQYELTKECAEKFIGIPIADSGMKNIDTEQGRSLAKVYRNGHFKMKWW